MPLTSLPHSPADVVAQLMVDVGLGTNLEDGGVWPVYVGDMPTSPDNCMMVTDTAGRTQFSQINGELMGPNGFQLMIRAKDHKTGWAKGDQAQTTFATDVYQRTVTIDNTQYFVHAIVGIGDILPVGKEAPTSKRRLFSLNALVVVKAL